LSISSGSRRGSNDAEDPGASVKAVFTLERGFRPNEDTLVATIQRPMLARRQRIHRIEYLRYG